MKKIKVITIALFLVTLASLFCVEPTGTVKILTPGIEKALAWDNYGSRGDNFDGSRHRHRRHRQENNNTPWYAWLLGAGVLYSIFK